MSSHRIARTGLRLAVLVPLLAITPLALAPTEGVKENRACARDVCVERIADHCYYNGNIVRDHYLRMTVE